MKSVVFDRITGEIGVRRRATIGEEKQHGVNYVVDVLDPIYMNVLRTESGAERQWSKPELDHNDAVMIRDWMPLSIEDDRYRFVNLFAILEDGPTDWYVDTGNERENLRHEVVEMYIENPHEVYKMIRGLFKCQK